MKLSQIDRSIKAIEAVGINLENFEDVELDVDLSERIQLVWIHKFNNIKMVVEDPNNYPTRIKIIHLD